VINVSFPQFLDTRNEELGLCNDEMQGLELQAEIPEPLGLPASAIPSDNTLSSIHISSLSRKEAFRQRS